MADVDIECLHSLSIGVRWPHRANDWDMLRSIGTGTVAIDDIGRAVGSAMWFDYGASFATIGMVITAPRLQVRGTATWLMDRVLQDIGNRNIGLNATRAAKRLYRVLGFQPECPVYQHQGRVFPPPTTETAAVERQPGDLSDILLLDREAFAADRSRALVRLAAVSKIIALVRGGKLVAYSFCREFGRGVVVGPVIAANDGDAIAVVRPHLLDHAGRFVRLDTREESGDFPQFLTLSGMPVFDAVTTMSYGRPWIGSSSPNQGKPKVYGLAAQALG